ncbi:unnamed protein product [Brassica rapa subsp. narinosa]
MDLKILSATKREGEFRSGMLLASIASRDDNVVAGCDDG